MIGLVMGLQDQLRKKLGFQPGVQLYFWRECRNRNCGCIEYYRLLDACPLRIPHASTSNSCATEKP